MIEKDMRQPIVKWLARQGMECVHEVDVAGRLCDVVGFRFAPRVGRPIPALLDVIAVELKLSRIADVLGQAKNNRWAVTSSFAAMPLSCCRCMRLESIRQFIGAGVGLLSVDGEIVRTVVGPTIVNDGREQTHRAKWWRYHLRNEKDGA